MRNYLLAGACALITGVVISAQRSEGPQRNTNSSDEPVSVIGCLQRAPDTTPPDANDAAVGTSGKEPADTRPGTDSDTATHLVLANTIPSDTDISAIRSTPRVTYRLHGGEAVLAPHVGYLAEISGVVDGHTSSSDAGPVLNVERATIVLDFDCQ